MDAATHLEHLAADGAVLADTAERVGLDARVFACNWSVRELVTHTSGIHRWAADIVRTGAKSTATDAAGAVGHGPGDDELIAWFRDGHAALIDTLRTAPDNLECAAFLPASSPRAFWARRQAHETAIHRADAESAGGSISPFDAEFAQDGIGEMLLGFAARKSNAIATPGVLGLHATDGDPWRVTFGGEHIEATRGDDGAAGATVSGSSSDLYLWLWNRPAAVTIEGDTAVADAWHSVRVRWG